MSGRRLLTIALVLESSWIKAKTLRIQPLNCLVLGFVLHWVAGYKVLPNLCPGRRRITWVKHSPVPQGTRGNKFHRYKTKFKRDTRFWTAQWLPGGNGQGTGDKAMQNLPTGFKHTWWIIVLGVFYRLDEECPVLQHLSLVLTARYRKPKVPVETFASKNQSVYKRSDHICTLEFKLGLLNRPDLRLFSVSFCNYKTGMRENKDHQLLVSKTTFLPDLICESQDLSTSLCDHLPTCWSATENTFEEKSQLMLSFSFANLVIEWYRSWITIWLKALKAAKCCSC